MWPDSLAVVGLGALGGSLAWRARVAGVPRVMGFSASPATSVQALRSGALTDRGLTPADTVRGAGLVVLAGTPAEVISLIPVVAPCLAPEAMLTDLAGAKSKVLGAVRAAGLAGRYAGLHPLVSPASQGFSGARADLFRGAITYVTADMEGEPARQAMRAFVSAVLEAEPVVIDAETHDRQVAWTLELPRAAARAVALALAEAGLRGAAFDAAVRGATATALDAGEGWDDRVLANPDAVAAALEALESEIARMRGAIQRGDAVALREMSAAAEVLARGVAR
jgi:prephenate dehydrogenase